MLTKEQKSKIKERIDSGRFWFSRGGDFCSPFCDYRPLIESSDVNERFGYKTHWVDEGPGVRVFEAFFVGNPTLFPQKVLGHLKAIAKPPKTGSEKKLLCRALDACVLKFLGF